MRRQPWPAKRAKTLEQAVAYLPSLEQSSAFPLAAPLRKVHVLGAVLPHIVHPQGVPYSNPLTSNFFGALLPPGECSLQHLRVLDCGHRADEMQHDEPVSRGGGGRGGR